MITADFRQIAFEDGPRKCEGLFRAAIAEFAEKPRPTKDEIAQIDDLALGLYDSVSREARHYAATILSRSTDVPPGLIRRLCDEPVDISAPLLVNSPVLSTVDQLRLIGRHGLSHARVIARRRNVDPVIASLVRLLNARAASEQAAREARAASPVLDEVRNRLRSLVHGREAETAPPPAPAPREPSDVYLQLRQAALSSDPDAFALALASALHVTDFRARRICSAITYSDLLASLKYLDLSEEKAFLLAATLYASQLFHGPAIRLFLNRYAAITQQEAAARIAEWRRHDRDACSPAGHSLVSSI